jgi:hypothetical protein
MNELVTLRAVLQSLLRHPIQLLVVRWNWKSAILSSVIRTLIFFVANLSAGTDAALAAMNTELIYRACTAGFYAALTQSFRHVKPEWQATLTAMVLLPLISHSLALLLHWQRGTPKLAVSILASAWFSTVSTAYNLFAMRQGALIVGQDARPLWEDLRRTPGIISKFIYALVVELPSTCWRNLRRWRAKHSPFSTLNSPWASNEKAALPLPENGELRMEKGE